MPQKTWVVGEEALAADFQTYVQNQVVATFPNLAGRDAWASPPNGALCITTDTNRLWQRVAGAWAPPAIPRLVGQASSAAAWGPAGTTPADLAGSLIGTTARAGYTACFRAVVPVVKSGSDGNVTVHFATGAGAVFYTATVSVPNNYSSVIVAEYWAGIGQTSYKLQVSTNSGGASSVGGTAPWQFSITEWPTGIAA